MLNSMTSDNDSYHELSAVTPRLAPFVTNIFDEMSRLARENDAINLGQGAPDFDGPSAMLEQAREAIIEGKNQYPPGLGVAPLRYAVAAQIKREYGLTYDPETECLITTGATEALAATMLGLLNPGDEVIVFEPFFDAYRAQIAMAGAHAVISRLVPWEGGFRFDIDHAASLITDKTRAIILNSPHNPSGTVISYEDLEALAHLAHKHDLIIITDEVYEYLTYDGVEHIPIATLEGMRDRTVRISSAAKTFNVTGWKIGWVTAPHRYIVAIRAAKQHLTFVSGGPFQYAVAYALDNERSWVYYLRSIYNANKNILVNAVLNCGFSVYDAHGSYFFLADSQPLGFDDGNELCRRLPQLIKVAAVPVSALAINTATWGSIVRFSFAVQTESLLTAAKRLADLPQLLKNIQQ